jgi:hypothetical protein
MNNERLDKIGEQIQNHMSSISDLIGELKDLTIKGDEPERKKAGKAWRAEINEDYFTVFHNGHIDKLKDFYWAEDNYSYFTGNYFSTKQEAEAHKRHIVAVGVWNRIANEYPSGCYSIAADGDWYGGTAEWSPLRHVNTGSNCEDAIMRFKKEGEDHGFNVDDLFLYANEVRHA